MFISKEDGKRNKKGLHAFPFSPEVETFYWLKGDKSAFTLMTTYHEDVSARVKVFVAKKISYRLQLKGCNNSANCI